MNDKVELLATMQKVADLLDKMKNESENDGEWLVVVNVEEIFALAHRKAMSTIHTE